ncbi:MAG TPA: DUF2911 domain-containing protein [Blastocatellia bacterium]|nr:DUF2911 domain-containing protein [Blastocatellia bacterium]
MRKTYTFIAVLIFLCVSACAGNNTQTSAASDSNSEAQNNSDRGQATLQLDGATVMVEYGRPNLSGRNLEKLIQPGQEWRMGSNTATTLTTTADLKFGDKAVPKGKYVLKAKPVSAQDWMLLIQNEDSGSVAEVPMKMEKVDSSTERMTIELSQSSNVGKFKLIWGNLTLSTEFRKA